MGRYEEKEQRNFHFHKSSRNFSGITNLARPVQHLIVKKNWKQKTDRES